MPGLAPKSHSAGSSAIKTTCRMPSGDPRQATVVTSWYPRGDEIYFDETGQYQFVSKGSNCTASVRRTRVLKRVIEKREPEPTKKETKAPEKPVEEPQPKTKPTVAKKAPSAAPPPPPKRASQCDKPGAPVNLEVSPKTKLMRVGESFSFQAIARDKNGCRAKIQTAFKLLSGSGGQVAPNGKVTIPKDAATGTLKIEAQVGDQSVTVTARVVTEEEYEALIAGGEYGVMGESLDAASVKLSTSHVEFETATGPEKKKDRTTLLAIVGGLFLALIGLAVFLVRRHNSAPAPQPAPLQEVPAEAPPAPEEAPTAPAPPVAPAPAAPAPAVDSGDAPAPAEPPKTVRLCPICGKRYEDGTMFCGEDGARLIRVNQ